MQSGRGTGWFGRSVLMQDNRIPNDWRETGTERGGRDVTGGREIMVGEQAETRSKVTHVRRRTCLTAGGSCCSLDAGDPT